MEELILNDDLQKRVTEFKQVIEVVLGQKVSLGKCVALILDRGIDTMLADILAGADQGTLFASFQQLASRHPAEVYGYVAETLRRGEAVTSAQGLGKSSVFSRPIAEKGHNNVTYVRYVT